MILYRNLEAACREHRRGPPRVATIGLFDGIHSGHRRLFGELRAWAKDLGAEPAVVTFDRHPLEVLRGRAPLRILSLRHRMALLAGEGIAQTLCLPFTHELSLWSPEEFVDRVATRALGARYVLFGFDSAFGHDRKGTYEYVSARSDLLGITVRQASVEKLEGERVSSTLVRQAFLEGDLERLAVLLGRTPSVLGRVVRGDARGRTLGFPTANLDVEGAALPPTGVYFAEVERLREPICAVDPSAGRSEIPGRWGTGESLGALVNVGKRPTFNDASNDASGSEPTVEIHIVDYEGDLYGSCLELRFLARHRPERRFESAEGLVAQIRSDIEAFRRFRSGAMDDSGV
jgi:riboflavin kinase/FMN adenylyltransferase